MSAIERIGVIRDALSTWMGLDEPEDSGDIIVHPRGGERITLATPNGIVLTIGCDDIIHVRGGQGFSRFTIAELPPGYEIL